MRGWNDKIRAFQQKIWNFSTTNVVFSTKKIVSIVSIVFKTTQESRLGPSPLPPTILAAKVLKTIETIETILKNNIFLFQHCLLALSYHDSLNRGVKQLQLFKTTLSLQKSAFVLRQLEHALDGLDGVACNVGRHIDGGPLVEKRVIHLLKGVHLHKLALVA